MAKRNTFSLAGLIPDGLEYIDDTFGGDGAVYTMLTPEMMSEQDMATMQRLQRQIEVATAEGEDVAGVAVRLAQFARQTLKLLIPTLPDERVDAIPLLYKTRIVEWWRDQVQTTLKESPTGE